MNTYLLPGLIKIVSGANIRWVGCVPEAKQRVYFANHTSNLDTVVLWAALPTELRCKTRPVAARDYWSVGKIRPFLAHQVFKALLIERQKVTTSNNPLTAMLEALKEDCSLIIFPEGGRHPGPEAGPFKSGLYHLGKARPDVELIPVYIDNMNRILPKGEILPVPLLTSLSFGAPIRVEPDETKQDFLERARTAVNSLHPL
jgi:1-acyl-sn-glycerol-3-phosphate acyltransferase